ncbi:MAG: tetratricopeptide repeat protein, partial [Pseudomonadota bacterium]
MSDAAGGTAIDEPPQSPHPSDPQDLKQQVRELIDEGLTAHQVGDLSLAETKYRAALKLDPVDSEGLHLLGIIACQNNSHDAAVTLIGHAINNHPDHPAVPPRYNVNLANALHGAGRLEDAVVALHRALSADPSSVEGHFNLGNVLCDLGRYEEAEGEYRFAIQLEPRYGKAHARLGWVLEQQDRPREAIEAIKAAAELNPEDGSLRVGLGRALAAAGRLEEALPLLEDLSSEDDAQSWTTLGSCYADQQRWEEARESFSQALKTAPRYAKAHGGLGEAMFRLGQCEAALTHLLRACELDPGDMKSLSLAGMINLDQGDLFIAVDRLEKAVAGAPDDHRAHAALVQVRALQRMSGEEGWRSECAAWVKKFDDQRPMPAGAADRLDPDRALQVGVITGGMPGETALQRLLTFLGYRDRDQVLVRCYSDLDSFEPLRPALIKLADGWTECRALSDGDLCATIHNDKIDILIDLSGSLRGNRLRALAPRPAPVQISWLGSGEQMGFSFVDYFLTDAKLDDGSVETSLPVTRGLMGFVAPDDIPQPGPLPLASGGPAQLVSMGNLVQFSEESIALFSRVLTELADARLRVIVHEP